MNATLIKALIVLIPAGLIFVRCLFLLRHHVTAGRILQLCGSVSLIVVVLTHIAEALHFLPFMGWGEAHSAGHYLDLASAVLAVTLLPVGWLLARQ